MLRNNEGMDSEKQGNKIDFFLISSKYTYQGCGIIILYHLSTDKWILKIHLSNQDSLARKLTYFLFFKENLCSGDSLEAPQWGASNDYPSHMFLWEIRKISCNLDTLLSWSYEVLVQGQVNWNFLLVLRDMRQVGQVGHSISTALHIQSTLVIR